MYVYNGRKLLRAYRTWQAENCPIQEAKDEYTYTYYTNKSSSCSDSQFRAGAGRGCQKMLLHLKSY